MVLLVITRTKFSQCQYLVGHHSGGCVKTGVKSGFNAAASIHPKGIKMNALRSDEDQINE